MKIGLITRRDSTGLGYQTKALYELLNPSRVLVVDSKSFNGNRQNLDWYKDADYLQISHGFPTDHEVDLFLHDLDAVITCEIPYNYYLVTIARERGIKTVIQPNAELNPYFMEKSLPKPDAFFLPSRWHEAETMKLGVKCYYCPPPISIQETERTITKKEGILNVLHIGGKPAFMDRNGTEDVKMIKVKNVNITISQQVMENNDSNEDIYKGNYDVVLLPRKYGGLCLPMREALAFGYPVIMPGISPNNHVLPTEWLTAPRRKIQRLMKRPIDVYENDIKSIERKLEWLRDLSTDEYTAEVDKALTISDNITKDIKWKEYLEEVVYGSTKE